MQFHPVSPTEPAAGIPITSGRASELEQHRFRNRLQLVTSLFSIEPQGAAARDSFLKWQTRLRSLARSLPEETSGRIGPLLRALADDLCSLTRRGPGHLSVVVTGSDDLRLPPSRTVPFALLAGELMRFVLANPQHGPGADLLVELIEDPAGTCHIRFRTGDNRRFLPAEQDGDVEILELLAEQAGARLSAIRETEWEILTPLQSC